MSCASAPGDSRPGRNGNEWTPHSIKLQYYWNLTIRLLTVLFWTLVGGVLPFSREAVDEFVQFSRLNKVYLQRQTEKCVSIPTNTHTYISVNVNQRSKHFEMLPPQHTHTHIYIYRQGNESMSTLVHSYLWMGVLV